MQGLLDFAGKRIVVTGAYSGIGAAFDAARRAVEDQSGYSFTANTSPNIRRKE